MKKMKMEGGGCGCGWAVLFPEKRDEGLKGLGGEGGSLD